MAGQFAAGLMSIGLNRGDINRKQRNFDNQMRLNADDRASQQAQLGVAAYLSNQRRMDEQKKAQDEAQAARAEAMRVASAQAENARQDGLIAQSNADMEKRRQASYGLSPQDEARAAGIVKQVVGANDAILKAGKIEQGIGQINKAYDDAAKSGNPAIYKLALAASGLHPNMTRPDDFSVKTEYDPKTREEYMVAYDGQGRAVSRNATGRKSEAEAKEAFNSQTHQDRIGKELLTVMGGKLDPLGQMSVPQGQEQKFARLNAIAQGIGREVGKKYSPGEIAAAAAAIGEKAALGMDTKSAQAQAASEAEDKAGWLSTDATDFKETGGSREKFIANRAKALTAGDQDAALRMSVMQRLGVQPQLQAKQNSNLPPAILEQAQAAIQSGADPAKVQARLAEIEKQQAAAAEEAQKPSAEGTADAVEQMKALSEQFAEQ
jgi:hypothetical protein